MKSRDVCEVAKRAGLSEFGKIYYRLKSGDWRYNVGFWLEDKGWWSFDCLGFVHCMVNGFSGAKKLGGGAVMDDFVTRTTEYETITNYCTGLSTDFSKIIPGECLYMPGHVGLYIGECEPFEDGRIYNAAECCYSSFGGGGMLTWVDPDGTRRNHRGGEQAEYGGYWTVHGKFTRVDYTDQQEPIPEPSTSMSPERKLSLVNDVFVGKYGNNPYRQEKLTELYGYDVYRDVQDIINILYK